MKIIKIERADVRITVPEIAISEHWIADEAQKWAREKVLFGGPPDVPEDPQSGKPVKWSSVKEYVGRKLRIRSKPIGLILTLEDGKKQFAPSDIGRGKGSNGFKFGTTVEEMNRKSKIESAIRTFARNEIELYNKKIADDIRIKEKRFATKEFWEAGKRIREFLSNNQTINQDQIWYALEQWGKGKYGYGKRWIEYATYFYDKHKLISENDPTFSLSETKIMVILMKASTTDEFDRLVVAFSSDALRELADEELKWITGKSLKTFPLTQEEFYQLVGFGDAIVNEREFGQSDIMKMREICKKARINRKKNENAQDGLRINE